MKPIKLFYLKACPYCQKALSYIDELKKREGFGNPEIEMIEESEEPEVADSYDYYYVPTFYVDGEKVHEGAATFEEIEAVFRKAEARE
ncbi:MAG: thioredoxin family protein [Tannerella sp.]|jgi:thiol-disulfide isomerase/thioredoxin|nr:thioredoxin family protein [Tannerella sp.]